MTSTKFFPCLCALGATISLLATGHAQESIRPSLTGNQASEARKAVVLPSNYNIKAGPVIMDITGNLEVEFNDNVGLSENNRDSDVIIRPQLRFASFWQVTRMNTLELNLGLGFGKYLYHSDLDTSGVLVDPGSKLSFDFYIGDFRINIHDRFAILQNPVDEVDLSNVGKFERFQNSIGLEVLWDLNDLKFVVGYDHFNFWALDEEFEYLDRSEEQFYGSASLDLSDAHRVGLDASLAFVNYDQTFNNDGVLYTAGAFWEMQMSNYIKLRLAGGYQGASFDGEGSNQDSTTDHQGVYGSATLSQRLNNYWTHSITLGHEARLGLTVNYDEFDYARYVAAWRAHRAMTVSFEGFIEGANESGSGITSEHSVRYGGGISLDWALNRRSTIGLRYQYTLKDSDIEFRSYYQNRALLNVSYDF